MAQAAQLPDSKRCTICFEWRPIAEFRRRVRGRDDLRRSECRGCYARQQREFRLKRKQRSVSKRLVEINREINPRRIVASCSELIRQLGGVDVGQVPLAAQLLPIFAKSH